MQGAERMVRVPSELQRFQALPMLVSPCPVESDQGISCNLTGHYMTLTRALPVIGDLTGVQVTHETESEKGSRVLRLIEMDAEAGTSVWGLADVKVNRDKRQKLTKRQDAQRFEIPLSAIKQARLHLDA